jgi:hypothetical protein
VVPEPSQKPVRRRVRVTRRLLMLVIVGLSVVLARTTNRARRQEAAIAKITRLGGKVGFDYNYIVDRGNWPPSHGGDPPAPRWLLERIGPEYFRQANFVGFADPPPKVRAIPDLAFLEDLPQVRVLVLDRTSFPDSELAHAHALNLIRFLATDSTLGDEGLAHLDDMAELWEIDLSGSRVTDRGLAHLARMPKLRFVELRSLTLTDAGLAHLSHLTNLERLTLEETPIGDDGLARLAGLGNLHGLDLRRTHVSDRGLVHLKAMPGLKGVALDKTLVTDNGVAELQRAMPKLVIRYR